MAWWGFFFIFLAAFIVVCSCSGRGRDSLAKIKKSGKLTIITDNNANCYYIYKDKPMGFEYDLTKAFADYLGVELEVITPGWNDMLKALMKGRGDLIAAGLTITPARENLVDFSDQYLTVQQQVIIHRDNHNVKRLKDLNGKRVHIRKGTSYHERLLKLKKEGLEVELVLYQNIPTEELLEQVAEKKINITVADSNIAFLNRRYYPALRIAFPIEEKQSLGWAVKKGDRKLLHKINDFFDSMNEKGTFDKIYEKYYANVEIFDYVDLKKYHHIIESRLPKYKEFIRNEAARYGFDWCLMAAVIYQESHFNPGAKSYTGVRGLMQLTLPTAREMGVKSRLDPRQSVRGGIKYLNKIHKRFEDIEGPDRMLFTLAAYNIGYGHVIDAQKIAREKGLNAQNWASLKKVLPLLRDRRYYQKTKYGYARGSEVVRYVERVLIYYDILKKKFQEGGGLGKDIE